MTQHNGDMESNFFYNILVEFGQDLSAAKKKKMVVDAIVADPAQVTDKENGAFALFMKFFNLQVRAAGRPPSRFESRFDKQAAKDDNTLAKNFNYYSQLVKLITTNIETFERQHAVYEAVADIARTAAVALEETGDLEASFELYDVADSATERAEKLTQNISSLKTKKNLNVGSLDLKRKERVSLATPERVTEVLLEGNLFYQAIDDVDPKLTPDARHKALVEAFKADADFEDMSPEDLATVPQEVRDSHVEGVRTREGTLSHFASYQAYMVEEIREAGREMYERMGTLRDTEFAAKATILSDYIVAISKKHEIYEKLVTAATDAFESMDSHGQVEKAEILRVAVATLNDLAMGTHTRIDDARALRTKTREDRAEFLLPKPHFGPGTSP